MTPRDGRSLDTAFRRILHAIHMAGRDDTIVIEPGVYDQDLAKRIGAARAAGVSVAVAGSEVEGAGGRQRGRQSAKAP